MKSFVFLLSLIFFGGIPVVSAQVPIAGQDPYILNCTDSFVDNVNIGADTLTIKTIFTANPVEGGYDWPSIAQTVTYSDGHVLLDRNFGAKLIDDFATCAEWYEVAHRYVVEDFATATIVRDLRGRYSTFEIDAVRSCLSDLVTCNAEESWRIPDEARTMTLSAFNSLVARPVRLLHLKYGAYQGTTMIFDTENRRLIPIYENGC